MKGLLSYIDAFLGKAFKRIEETSWVGTQSLAYFRILMGLFLLLHYIPEWSWLGNAPQALFNPHMFTIAYLSDGFMPMWFYVSLDLMNIVFFCLLTLGIYSRFSLFVLFIVNYTGLLL